ncbi:MAG: hypothetical protein J6Y37_05865 [Paludibacteraceae bacterium]|nr:hypothetical protein [Paludibacteraceae bacterium]
MYYQTEFSVDNFPWWSGARTRVESLKPDQRRWLSDYIEEYFNSCEKVPTDTAINDFVWFDCDDFLSKLDKISVVIDWDKFLDGYELSEAQKDKVVDRVLEVCDDCYPDSPFEVENFEDSLKEAIEDAIDAIMAEDDEYGEEAE